MADKIKLVMIDDEQDLCAMVKTNLEDTGEFEVLTCSDPKQAEAFVRQHMPSIILMDVVMPGLKGSEIATALKKSPDTKKIPIIIVSGKGEMIFDRKKNEFKWQPNNPLAKQRGQLPDAKGAEALAAAYQVDDYISKPFTTELLLEVIKDVLARYRKAPAEDEGTPGVGV